MGKSYFITPYRMSLASDLKDENLVHWTTSPDSFLVVTPRSNPDMVLGMVAYQVLGGNQISLNRLAVDKSARGTG